MTWLAQIRELENRLAAAQQRICQTAQTTPSTPTPAAPHLKPQQTQLHRITPRLQPQPMPV